MGIIVGPDRGGISPECLIIHVGAGLIPPRCDAWAHGGYNGNLSNIQWEDLRTMDSVMFQKKTSSAS